MIKVEHLSKSFGTLKALNDISFTVDNGSIFGLVGSNGAGKSTLLRILSGVYRADEGCVEINGEEVFDNQKTKNEVIYISDYPYFTNSDTLNTLAKKYKIWYSNFSVEVFEKLKSQFPVNANTKINTMSKGMQRQCAIILALSSKPKCILFDEIFDGLDPVIRELVKKSVFESLTDNDTSIVIASHNLRELEDICDHICLLHLGGMLLQDELDNLKLNILRIQFALNDISDWEKIKGKLNIVKENIQGKMIEITVRGNEKNIIEIINSINPMFCEVLPLTLEELFISEMEVAGYDIDKLVK